MLFLLKGGPSIWECIHFPLSKKGGHSTKSDEEKGGNKNIHMTSSTRFLLENDGATVGWRKGTLQKMNKFLQL